ncbi:MAG: tripartite tricarboxylate transporter permease [Candidatus Aenigmarchaeota archaeon]|nr:tripartite tricarboxylate transporter permease [Candidatus Aenigmarchaeota archaeon]
MTYSEIAIGMFIETVLFSAAGIALGVLAGLVPGLHPNTVLMVLASLVLASGTISTYPFLALVVSMSVVNTIVNFIPSIFLGAPEPDSCLSVLPGHRMLLRGEGYEALHLTVVGGVAVLLLTVIALPFVLWFIPFLYSNLRSYIHILLLAVLILLLMSEKGRMKAYSALFFMASGMMGFFLLSLYPGELVLFPALSGLFGFPVILTSMAQGTKLPPQATDVGSGHDWRKGGIGGWLAGMFVGILPGIGSAQAGVIASRALRGNEKDFLIALGGINTSNIIFTFIALQAIGKARSGAAWAVSEVIGRIGLWDVGFIVMIALASCLIASKITLRLGRGMARTMHNIDYRKVNSAVLVLMIALILLITGPAGLAITSICALLGMACTRAGAKKMYLMGFLMLPTIMFFSGIS